MMSCFSCTIPSHFMCIIPSSLLHSEYSGLEMEVTGIVSILEAMEGIDNSLSSVYVAILTPFISNVGSFISEEGEGMLVLVFSKFFSGTVQCRSIQRIRESLVVNKSTMYTILINWVSTFASSVLISFA